VNAMRKVCDDFSPDLRESNGEPGHVHLLVQYPPKVPVSALVNSLKGVSARRLRADSTGPLNRASAHRHFGSRPTSPPAAGVPHCPPSVKYVVPQQPA
jgi:putative transposase